jgi:hypothetical protein
MVTISFFESVLLCFFFETGALPFLVEEKAAPLKDFHG